MTSVQITAGFLPLTDSAILIAARERGFAAAEGIELNLVRETSWANIRDRVAIGHFDIAHMLAPMPIAASLGLTPMSVPMIAPFALGLGGNAITVSAPLWAEMANAGARANTDPVSSGKALKAVVAAWRGDRERPIQIAVVHPHSGHNYELRYWLAANGVDPDKDLEIVIVPPSFMPDAIATGRIDGFCVGEPWNSVAVSKASAHIATVKAAIWKSSPEKVIGITQDWAETHLDELAAMLRALYRAAEWCEIAANQSELAAILARREYLNVRADHILFGLSGELDLGNGAIVDTPDFFIPFARAATFPWQSHALWFYSQMVRWKQVSHSASNAKRARAAYRPDLYRAALKPIGAPLPGANAKVEGALTAPAAVGVSVGELMLGPDGFFDGLIFDPDHLDAYIMSQSNN
jgi:two-component system, oxyanion-binding sensor